MGRGSSKAGGGGGGDLQGKGGAASNVRDVQDLISNREQFRSEANEVLAVGKRLNDLYGSEGQITQFQTAKMEGAFAYYDSNGNIAINEKYMNNAGMDKAYDVSVNSGFHPSRGNKSGIQAVAAHEYGHALSDKAAKRLGAGDLESASRMIVERARAKTAHKSNMAFAKSISGYASYNFAECVAEAVADWHCNGGKAKKESRAVMAVVNNILKH